MRILTPSAPGTRVVVAGELVSEDEAGARSAGLGRFETEFGIEQDRAGVRREHAAHSHFEFAHDGGRDGFHFDAAGGGECLLQAAALIHGRGRDDAVLV